MPSRPKIVPAEPPAERATRTRQRARLIDACISALHLYGPSRTTVEKVVGLADMSPGIVTFYFETKAAMLVAALEFLATEFEEKVILPVKALSHDPVRALDRLIELYLDPELASPRKVSVWYAFWGEASSRREYLDICGHKDESFAALVQTLIAGVIVRSAAPSGLSGPGAAGLDVDAIALGLIGCLEMIWQGIAFQDEARIDRAAEKARCRAYLRSIFPAAFGVAGPIAPAAPALWNRDARNGDAQNDPARLFRPAWQVVGTAAELAEAGGFLTFETAQDRAIVWRGPDGGLRAFRNRCVRRPHALSGLRHGRFEVSPRCAIDGLDYGFDGIARGERQRAALTPLPVVVAGGLVLVSFDSGQAWPPPLPDLGAVLPVSPPVVIACETSWRRLIEARLDVPAGLRELRFFPCGLEWAIPPCAGGWSAERYHALAEGTGIASGFRRQTLVFPGLAIETYPGGATIMQSMPLAPDRVRVWVLEVASPGLDRATRAIRWLAARLARAALVRTIEIAVSTEAGARLPDPQPPTAPESPAEAAFRQWCETAPG